jgi:predicted AlkP superfamily phosphohydrolase/phosphomutase
VGIDGFSPFWMDRFLAQGVLPRIGELASGGVTSSLRSTLPATTPVAWATVATGCPPTITGIDANLLHRPGDPLDRRLGCYAHRCEAEPVWATATAARKRSYVVKFPVSYPSSTATFRLDGAAGWAGMKCLHEFGPAAVADTRETTSSNALRAHPEAWAGKPDRGAETLWLGTWRLASLWDKAPVTLHVAVRRSAHGEVRVALADRPDWQRALAEVAPGGWSEPITVRADGRRGEAEVSFRCKVLECSGEPFRLRLYNTVVHERRGHSEPAEVWDRHLAAVGPIEEQTDPFLLFDQGIDLRTQWELFRINAEWLQRAAVSLITGEPWDLFMIQVHFTDWAHHILEGGLDPRHQDFRPADARRFERALLDSYLMADEIVGAVRDNLGPDTDLVVVGDHGQDLHHTTVHVNEWLAGEGLLAWDGNGGEVDWSRTQAFAAGNFVYLNQEGREPTGIVPPKAAARLTHRICHGLLDLEDPGRGARPILIAGRKEDFRALGGDGKGVGDVVFLCRSGYQARNNPGELFEPTRLLREFTSGHDHFSPLHPRIRTRLFAAGPSFRPGYRRPGVASLTDVAPTLCAVLGIAPAPGCEGGTLTDLLSPAAAGRAPSPPPAAQADQAFAAHDPLVRETSSPSLP